MTHNFLNFGVPKKVKVRTFFRCHGHGQDSDSTRGCCDISARPGAVDAARARLGARVFTEHTGEFWLVVRTRPFMRALHALELALLNDKQLASSRQRRSHERAHLQ